MTGGGLELPGRENLKPEQTLSNSLKDMADLAAREGRAAGRAGSLGFFEERGIAPEDLPGSSVQRIVALADQAMVDPVAQRADSIGQLIESIAVQRDQTMQIAERQLNQLVETGQWNDLLDQKPEQARELWDAIGMVGNPQKMRTPEPELFGSQKSGYYKQVWDDNLNGWVEEQVLPPLSDPENGGLVFDIVDKENGEVLDEVDITTPEGLRNLYERDDIDVTYEELEFMLKNNSNDKLSVSAINSLLETSPFLPKEERVRTTSKSKMKMNMLSRYLEGYDIKEAKAFAREGLTGADKKELETTARQLEVEMPMVDEAFRQHPDLKEFLSDYDDEIGPKTSRIIDNLIREPYNYIVDGSGVYKANPEAKTSWGIKGEKLLNFE